jgi:dimethylamine/trimethylamine dehydrogenase
VTIRYFAFDTEWPFEIPILRQAANVGMYLHSELQADAILDYGIAHVALATGARWRRDGVGRSHRAPLPFLAPHNVLTPDDFLNDSAQGVVADGPVVIFDDDRFYMASVLAELLVATGHPTIFVTPAPIVAPWSEYTLEQERIQTRLIELGVEIHPLKQLAGMTPTTLRLACVYSGRCSDIACGTLVSVTSRLPNDTLWQALSARQHQWKDAGLQSVTRIGDCLSPGLIAAACHSGHAYARAAGAVEGLTPLREDFAAESVPRI